MPYAPKTWALSDPITPTDLNRIETGLDAAVAVTDAVGAVPTWVTVGGGGAPAYGANYSAIGASLGIALAFTKDAFGWVRFRGGAACNGTIGTVFTLPVGYRPPVGPLKIACDAAGGHALVSIESTGVITQANGATSRVNLDNVSFYAG